MKRRRLSSPSPAMDHAEQMKSRDTIQDKVIPKIFSYITLCDIESLSEATGVNYSNDFGLNIEECCLQRHPVESSEEIYKKYGETTTILTMKNIDETCVEKILKYFTAVKDFTMHNMTILASVEGLPTHLARLTIVNCEIKESLMKTWIYKSEKTLTHLHLDNLVYSYHPDRFGSRISLRKCKNLISMSMNGASWELILFGHKLQSLHLTATDFIRCTIYCPNLTHLHFDVPSTSRQFMFKYAKSLEKLTKRNWIDPECLLEFPLLNRLEILSAVPIYNKPEVESLAIPELKVHFEPTSHDPDLIFEMLNEYCLLEIIRYLPARDWIQFATLHPRVECAVDSYKYPRAKLSLDDIPLEMLEDIAPLVRNIEMDKNDQKELLFMFRSLKSLRLSRITFDEDWMRLIPVGLERLSLNCRAITSGDVVTLPMVQQMSPTLRVLETNFYYPSFMHLRNLREIRVYWVDSVENVSKILELNKETLERVELSSDRKNCGSLLKLIQEMPKLKILGIRGEINVGDQFKDLFKDIGPQLKKLSVTVDQEIMMDLVRSGNFNCLQELDVGFKRSFKDRIVFILKSLTTLRKLRLYFIDPFRRDDTLLEDHLLVELLIALPQLSELIVPLYSTIPFGHEPRQFLQKRTLRIREHSLNSFVDVPKVK